MLTNLTRSNVDTGTDQSTDDILTKYDPANKIMPDSLTLSGKYISSNLRSEGRMDGNHNPPSTPWILGRIFPFCSVWIEMRI